jgi:hypothetical protein
MVFRMVVRMVFRMVVRMVVRVVFRMMFRMVFRMLECCAVQNAVQNIPYPWYQAYRAGPTTPVKAPARPNSMIHHTQIVPILGACFMTA